MAAALLVMLGSASRWGERIELQTQDGRFSMRGPRHTQARIVIAAVDRDTLTAWPEPRVFWGTRYAALIREARRAGAVLIGLDSVPQAAADDWLRAYGAKSDVHPDDDLAMALQAAGGGVVLAQVIESENGRPILPADRYMQMEETQGRIGFIDLPTSPDGVIRRGAARAEARETGEPVLSFAAQLAALYRGIPSEDTPGLLRLARGGRTDAPDRVLAGCQTPDEFWLNYTGTNIPTISAARLAAGTLTDVERQRLKDAIVLIGDTVPESKDRHRTPNETISNGVEIHAQMLATLLDGRPLRRAVRAEEIALVLAFGLASVAIAALLSVRAGLVLLSGATLIWSAAAFSGFSRMDLLLPLAWPLVALGLPWTSHQVLRGIQEGYRRLHLEAAFGRYASPKVVEYLLASPDREALGGETFDISVLFLDIRDFVKRSAGRDPHAAMAELNEFFGVLVPVIDANGGLLSRYTGDGFLAVFGAPERRTDHAQAATDAARQIVARVHTYNRESGRTAVDNSGERLPWRIGCAVYSGTAVCGNLGVKDRSEFTVIGDTVNFASRLEQKTKELQCELLLSAATYQALSDRPEADRLDGVSLRGRDSVETVYRVHTDGAGPDISGANAG